MLIREGPERTIHIDMQLAAVLSLVAGAVNSAGFHALGFFSANMTGNASMVSDLLALGEFTRAIGFLVIIVAFILGAYCSALLIEFGRRRTIRTIYARVIGLEALALVALGLFVIVVGTETAAPLMLLTLSFLMGLQNAATTRISNSRVRTTHISGVATDIGIGLASLHAAGENRSQVASTMKLHGLTIACFIAGGLAGVLLYEAVGGMLLVIAGGLLFAAALREVARSPQHRRPPSP